MKLRHPLASMQPQNGFHNAAVKIAVHDPVCNAGDKPAGCPAGKLGVLQEFIPQWNTFFACLHVNGSLEKSRVIQIKLVMIAVCIGTFYVADFALIAFPYDFLFLICCEVKDGLFVVHQCE